MLLSGSGEIRHRGEPISEADGHRGISLSPHRLKAECAAVTPQIQLVRREGFVTEGKASAKLMSPRYFTLTSRVKNPVRSR